MNNTNTPKRAVLLALIAVVLYYYGLNTLLTYSLPLMRGEYGAALRSPRGNKPEVLYNGASADYEAGINEKDAQLAKSKLNNAKRALMLAYQEIVGKDGKVLPGKERLASDVQFLLGKTMQTLEKVDKAKEAYKQSLRLDPTNVACKYNLEMLQQGGGGGGGGEGSQGKAKEGGDPADGNQGEADPSSGKPKPKI